MATLKNNTLFLTLTALFAMALAALLLTISKGELHLALNAYHAPALDMFFRFYTLIADYGVYVLVLLLLFYKAGWAALLAVANIVAGLLVQIVKHIVNAPRPSVWFAEHLPEQSLPVVDGVSLHSFFSFPSGHTTTFFAIALVMSYLLTSGIQNKRTSAAVQALLFLFAAIGGYSRVYLSQHFAADVLGGCLIGTIITLLLCMLTDHYAINTAAWWSWCIGGSKRRTS